MDPDPDPRKEIEVDPDPDLDTDLGLKWIRIRIRNADYITNISKNVRLVDGIIRILKRKDQIIIGPNR